MKKKTSVKFSLQELKEFGHTIYTVTSEKNQKEQTAFMFDITNNFEILFFTKLLNSFKIKVVEEYELWDGSKDIGEWVIVIDHLFND